MADPSALLASNEHDISQPRLAQSTLVTAKQACHPTLPCHVEERRHKDKDL